MSTQTAIAESLSIGPTISVTVGDKVPLKTDGFIPAGTTMSMHTASWTISQNKKYVLTAQVDGNLVLYKVADGEKPPVTRGDTFKGNSLWDSGTDRKRNPDKEGDHAIYETKGNFVVYTDTGAKGWQSNTDNTAPYAVIVQDDGNLVLYRSGWASNTTQK